jgi:NADPH-dependent 7-cyano-7-deazaguanine reductase QueF
MENAAPLPAAAGLTRLSQHVRPQESLPELATFDGPSSLASLTLRVGRLGKLCPSTGRPDEFGVEVTYTPTGGRCLELESLVHHLEAYWMVAVSAERLADQLAAAVLEATRADRVEVAVHQTGREGAELHVTAHHPAPSHRRPGSDPPQAPAMTLQAHRLHAIAADIEDALLTVRIGRPLIDEQLTALSAAAEDLAAATDESFQLRLPKGWALLKVGFSTPTLPLRDGVSGAWIFAMAPEVTDGVAAFRAVVEAWAADPATKATAKEAGHAFNYGDAIDYIGPATWRAAGLVQVRLPALQFLDLDHDEVLVDPEETQDA